MVGAHRKLSYLVALAVLALVPGASAESMLVKDAFSGTPLEIEETGTATCSGVAPLQPRCTTGFVAYSSLSTSVSGTFTGELVCRFTGPYGSWLTYHIEVVGGLAILASRSGPGLYAGAIALTCDAKGPFGAGGSLGGVGNYVVKVTYT